MSTIDIGSLSGNQNYSGFVDTTDPNDLYKFSIAGTGNFKLALGSLSNNADVQLLNSSGNVMYSSTNPTTSSESIIIDNLTAGAYSIRVLKIDGDTNYNLSLTLDNKSNISSTNNSVDPITGLKIESGYFTVGQTGEVDVEFVFDGGWYKGETAIFSLEGMDKFVANSKEFIKEAATRALSNSSQGYVAISDPTEGAKFTGNLKDSNYNDGQYLGIKKFAMKPGDKFGVMLVPNGKVQEVFNNPAIGGVKQPIFSLVTQGSAVGQIADINNAGTAFAIEDLRVNAGADKDYNDIIFKLSGATGKAVALDKVMNPARDWRGTKLGKEVLDYVKEVSPIDTEPPDNAGNTLSTARKILLSSDRKTYSGQIGGTDTNDYYRFSLGMSNKFNLSLDGLNADANVQLLDSNGTVIQSSTNSGTLAESISRTLDAGTYYLGVSPVANAKTSYNLNLAITSLIDGITTTGSNVRMKIDDVPISITNGSTITPQSNPSASSLIGMDKFRADSRFAGIDGKGFATVILDTGIDLNHPFFGPDKNSNGIADRIVYNYDFAYGDGNASDVDGHGSNVSSIVASQDGTYKGMAPGANIIHLKVLQDDGTGDFADTEQALAWVVANAEKYNIASVNMSLGDGQNRSAVGSDYGLGDELAALAAKNVIVVSASGNDFYKHGSNQGVSYPSADPNSLSVGAVWDGNYGEVGWQNGAKDFSTGADRIVSFSQRHSTLTSIFAPGALITGAGPNGGTVQMGGTSQAAPHIAGIAVLAQQLAVKELGRRLTPNEFKNLLQSTGVTINDGDNENDNVTNTGLNFKRVNMPTLAEGILAMKKPNIGNDRVIDLIRQERGSWVNGINDAEIFQSKGDWTFNKRIQLPNMGAMNGDFVNLIAGDFDGNGISDFIRQEKGNWVNGINDAQVYLGAGNGTFKNPIQMTDMAAMNGNFVNLIAGDFNGDKYTDIIRQEKGSWVNGIRDVEIYLSNKDGTFKNPILMDNADVMNGNVVNLIVGDFNGGGADDIIRQEKGNWVNGINDVEFRTFSNGNFIKVKDVPDMEAMNGDFVNLVAGDFNRDGITDIIRQEKGSRIDGIRDAEIYISDGNWGFKSRTLMNNASAMNGDNVNLIVGDLTGGGADDIIRQEKNGWVDGVNDVEFLTYSNGNFVKVKDAPNMSDLNGNYVTLVPGLFA